MDWVVGLDMSPRGDAALAAVARIAAAEGAGLEIGVVVVLTQQDLDGTGEISGDKKRSVALERAFPAAWRRIDDVLSAEGIDSESLSLDVIVRVAAVHLVRSQEQIAIELLRVMLDHGAPRIALGRRGRPSGVAEYLEARGVLEELPGSADGVLSLCVELGALDLEGSERHRSGPR